MSMDAVTERLLDQLSRADKLYIGDTPHTFKPYEELDEALLEKAKRELRETPEVVQESFKILCDLLGEDEELYVPMELEFLQKFLRRCKWYPKSAYKLIKRFYEYQQNHPEFFKDLFPSNERAVMSSGCIIPIPRRTADGCRITVIHAGKIWNPKQVSLNQLFRGVLLCLNVTICEPVTQVAGVRVIIDMEGLSLSQVTYFTPTFAASIVEFLQRCLPVRLKGVHIVNQSFLFDMVFAFFKPFLKGKLKDRIYFHGTDRASILAHFDAHSLPKKYGGNYDIDSFKDFEKLYKHSCFFDDYFHELARYGCIKDM